MIWITRDLELLDDDCPGIGDISFTPSGNMLHGGKTYRKLTPKMFSLLRKDKKTIRENFERYATLIDWIYSFGCEREMGLPGQDAPQPGFEARH
jgi:hypothetical protein